ncbi:MAG: TRM11 family SAM-dependent methyltransferase [Candidatus Saccharimonadales bacterium]
MTHKSLFILGRQPALGRAELESLFGAENLEPVGERAIGCTLPWEDIPFDRLGGSVRLAKPLGVLPAFEWRDIARRLAKVVRQQIDLLPEGKVKLGLSVFGLQVRPQQLVATGLELKKICRVAGRSARLVPNTETELSSAQVLHNQLDGELGLELLILRAGGRIYLAQTKKVQDIEAYSRRDQNRPKRDARVGMLPPKLAQIIVNLATSSLPASDKTIVLDPFCGTGVVLQEALLMGYGAYGTDLEPRMIDYTQKNLEWLGAVQPANNYTLEVGDATSHEWQHPFAAVASETYLGRPLSAWPGSETLQNLIATCNTVIKKFLGNIAGQIPSGTRLCLAVPLWKNPNGKNHTLPFLDHLGEMGYNRVSFEHAEASELVYFRPEQIVARQLLVITRN